MGLLSLLFVAGLATWIATSTIVEAEIFRDVREAIDRLHSRKDNWLTYKLRYLIQCHMCTGIWVAAIVAVFLPPLVATPVIGWGLTALAVKGIAHLFLVLQKYFEALTNNANAESELKHVLSSPVPTVQNEDSLIPDYREGGPVTTGLGWPDQR